MSDAEKMQSLDLPMALLMLAGGIACIALRKQQAAARQERIRKGELSEEEARKKGRVFYWCGYGITLGGIFLFGMWATGH